MSRVLVLVVARALLASLWNPIGWATDPQNVSIVIFGAWDRPSGVVCVQQSLTNQEYRQEVPRALAHWKASTDDYAQGASWRANFSMLRFQDCNPSPPPVDPPICVQPPLPPGARQRLNIPGLGDVCLDPPPASAPGPDVVIADIPVTITAVRPVQTLGTAVVLSQAVWELRQQQLVNDTGAYIGPVLVLLATLDNNLQELPRDYKTRVALHEFAHGIALNHTEHSVDLMYDNLVNEPSAKLCISTLDIEGLWAAYDYLGGPFTQRRLSKTISLDEYNSRLYCL